MADLVILPIADQIESGAYLLDDGACSTEGILTVAEERLKELGLHQERRCYYHGGGRLR